MIVVYLGALLAALGAVAVQLLAGHDSDMGGGGHDVHGADHDAALWTFVASIRFWSFALLAFGLIGTMSTWLGLAGMTATLITSIVCGIGSGVTAVSVVRRLSARGPSSNVATSDIVGRVGRVIVPPNEAGRAKIRVEVKGSYVDYVARSSESIAEGDAVLVEALDEGEVSVSKAPKELKP